jgi:lipoate-protein ligase A
MPEPAATFDLSVDNSREGRWRVISVPVIHSAEISQARQQALADELTSQSSAPALMIWRCQPSLLVTRSEARLPHFDDACTEMRTAGWPVLLRKSGGAACPVGTGTVQMSLIEPVLPAATMMAKYTTLAELIQETLRHYQIATQIGPVIGAYCPGGYDLAADGKKIAGMSQHWFRNRCGTRCVATTASINVEEAPDDLASVVTRFYRSAGSHFCCNAATLTNVRLGLAAPGAASHDLPADVMSDLAVHASTCSSKCRFLAGAGVWTVRRKPREIATPTWSPFLVAKLN